MRILSLFLFTGICLMGGHIASGSITAEIWDELGLNSATDNGISNDTVDGTGAPSIAVDPINGDVYVTWEASNSEVYVKKWNGSAWGEVGLGSASGTGISGTIGSSVFPSIAIGPDQQPVVAWLDDSSGNWEIYVLKFLNSISWDPVGSGTSATGGGISNAAGTITGANATVQPSVAISSSNQIFVAWATNPILAADGAVYVSTPSGVGTWITLGTRVDSCANGAVGPCEYSSTDKFFGYGGAGQPSLAVDSTGAPVVVYVTFASDQTTGDTRDVHVRRWNGTSWAPLGPGAATDDGVSAVDPQSTTTIYNEVQIVVGPDGATSVAWLQVPFSGNKRVRVRRFSAGIWTTYGTYAADSASIFGCLGILPLIALAVGTDNRPIVAWMDVPIGSINYEIYLRKWHPSFGWQEYGNGSASGIPPLFLEGGISANAGDSGAPALAVETGLNNAYIAWGDLSSTIAPFSSQVYVRGTVTPLCPWDCQAAPQSGAVDVPDLLALLGAWGGPQTPGTTCDFDGSGAIEVPDLLKLLANWGPCP